MEASVSNKTESDLSRDSGDENSEDAFYPAEDAYYEKYFFPNKDETMRTLRRLASLSDKNVTKTEKMKEKQLIC